MPLGSGAVARRVRICWRTTGFAAYILLNNGVSMLALDRVVPAGRLSGWVRWHPGHGGMVASPRYVLNARVQYVGPAIRWAAGLGAAAGFCGAAGWSGLFARCPGSCAGLATGGAAGRLARGACGFWPLGGWFRFFPALPPAGAPFARQGSRNRLRKAPKQPLKATQASRRHRNRLLTSLI